MQHKSHKLLYLFAFFIILLAGLLIAAGPANALPEEPYPVEVRFADTVTLEQASAVVAQTNATVQGQWRWEINFQKNDGVWSGGVDFTPGQNIQVARGQIWKEYVGLVNSTKNSVGSRIDTQKAKGEDVPPNRQRQYDANIDELAWLEEHIAGCWDTNSCPPIPTHSVLLMATQSTVRQLQSNTLVKSVDPVFPPVAFFLMKALGFLPQS